MSEFKGQAPPIFLTLDEAGAYRSFSQLDEPVMRSLGTDDSIVASPMPQLSSGTTSNFWSSDSDVSTRGAKSLDATPIGKALTAPAAFEGPQVVIPVEPVYVEAWSSLFTVSANILDRISAILGNTPNVQFKHSAQKSKIKGTYTASGQTVKFAIYLYKAPTLGYTVEVCRRAGDCLLFNSLYAGLKNELGNIVAPRQATPSFEDDLLASLPPLEQILSF